MLVGDVIELSKIKLGTLAISKNNTVLIKLIYLGLAELYRRFNLRIKSETIITNKNTSMYELKNDDVALFLGLYNSDGVELKQSDVVDAKLWNYKLVNYRSFILNHPKDDVVYAVYSASPILLKDENDVVDVPDAMIEALLCYIAYMGLSSIRTATTVAGRGTPDVDFAYSQFNAACQQLEMQGYKIPLSSESLSIYVKGYV